MECRLIFQAIDWALCADSSSGGPNIISDGHHQRSTASWAIACCRRRAPAQRQQEFVPLALVEGLLLADADHRAGVGAVRAAAEGTWLVMAAPSTSQPIAPTSAQVRVG